MSSNTIIFLTYLTYIPLIMVSVWCWLNFKYLRSEFKVLSIFVFVSFVTQAMAELLAEFGINNMSLSHGYTIIGFLVLTRFYRPVLKPFFPVKWFNLIDIGFTVLAVLNIVFWQSLLTFNSVSLTAEAVILIILSLATFILTLNEELNQHLRNMQQSINWINAGILIYYSGSLLLFFNGNAVIHIISRYWSAYTWLIYAVLMAILFTCLLIGLWKSPKELSYSKP